MKNPLLMVGGVGRYRWCWLVEVGNIVQVVFTLSCWSSYKNVIPLQPGGGKIAVHMSGHARRRGMDKNCKLKEREIWKTFGFKEN